MNYVPATPRPPYTPAVARGEEPPVPPDDEWPNETNTGVPPGTVLTNSGSLTITTDGAIVENLNITGSILVLANNVTIRNCRIDATGQFWGIDTTDRDTIVNDCEIFFTNNSAGIGEGGVVGRGTYRRLNIYGFENGISTQGGNLIEDCYIHDLAGDAEAHIDGISIQGGSGQTVRHCRIEAYNTSCVFIKDDFSAISDITIDNNLLINTPGQLTAYTVYSDARGPGGGISGVSFTDNVMEIGDFGYASFEQNTPVWTNNRDYITNEVIPDPPVGP